MPKFISNKDFMQASLNGAKYADGSPPRRHIKKIEPEIQPVEKTPEIDFGPVIQAIESIQPAMPRPPMTYSFAVTSRDADGKVATFTVSERINV